MQNNCWGGLINIWYYTLDIKKLWYLLNEITGKLNDSLTVNNIFIVNGTKRKTDPASTSNEFCEYLSNIGKNQASGIPNGRTHPKQLY